MRKRFKKLTAVILASALLLQGGVQTMAQEEQTGETQEAQVESVAETPAEASAETQAENVTEAPAEMPTEKVTEAPTEAPTEKMTEAPTEAPTEKTTEAPTEKVTEAPTEKATEAPTEKVTEAPTEKATEAPTEKVTEAPTEKATEAPTEKATEAPTEKVTEAPAADTETSEKEETDKDKKKKDKKEKDEEETETERSARINDGEKLTSEGLAGKLESALPYLFAAGSLSAPEALLEGQAVLSDAQGQAVADALAEVSLAIANGKSSSDVEVINLYADENGRLDTAQLDEKYKDHVIDVTDKYYVINVIADEEDQKLSFSGYDMILSGQSVDYTEGSEPGDILYNFAAMDDEGEEFVGYKGDLSLTGGRLLGTFLAPEAKVTVGSELAGAVYAKAVTVEESADELLQIAFVKGRQPETDTDADETETATEETETTAPESEPTVPATEETETAAPVTEPVTEEAETAAPETEPVTEETETTAEETETAAPETETEPVTEEAETAAPETDTDAEETETAVPETEPVADETETAVSETETETAVDGIGTPSDETETLTQEVTEILIEDTETEPASDTEAVTETPDTAAGETLENETTGVINTEYNAEIVLSEKLSVPAQLSVKLVDSADNTREVPGTIAIYAAEDIVTVSPQSGESEAQSDTQSGTESAVPSATTTVYKRDGVVTSSADTANASLQLEYTGGYYLTAETAASAYLMPRRYFTVNAEGLVTFADQTDWDKDAGTLTLKLYERTDAVQSGVSVSVVEKTNENESHLVEGAAFVVKGAQGTVLRDASGNPLYYFVSGARPVVLTGLADGTYYISQVKAAAGHRIAADQEFSVTNGTLTEVIIENPLIETASAKTLQASAHVRFNGVQLSALENETAAAYYATLFADADMNTRISEPKALVFQKDADRSQPVSFEGLTAGTTCFLVLTDEYGERLPAAFFPTIQNSGNDQAGGASADRIEVLVPAEDSAEENTPAIAEMTLDYGDQPERYPTGFYYEVTVSLTKKLLDKDGSPRKSSETFYANVFSDMEHKNALLTQPYVFHMGGEDTVTAAQSVKAAEASVRIYAAETDSSGNVIKAGKGSLNYSITLPNSSGELTVACAANAAVSGTITNQLSDALVKVRVLNENQRHLGGATLVVKDSSRKAVASLKQEMKFASATSDITLDALPEGDYYLSEISAPSGYVPAPDVAFTVEQGRETTVTLENAKESATGYSLAVSLQVYCGQYPLYAQESKTFYAALFEDSACTRKVSNVRTVSVSGLSGSLTFGNLQQGKTYYLAETTQYGEVIASTSSESIRYTDGGKVTMDSASKTMVMQNIYTERPAGFRYTGTLTITMNVQDPSGAAKAVQSTFYAGIFRQADYSDKPTIVTLSLNNSSTAYKRSRILLSGDSDVTYYIAEVDANGTRIENSGNFGYSVTIDQPAVTISRGTDKTVTITNREISSKVTLYLTKRVYKGASKVPVSRTFYAGLFKDSQFTQLYANPIALNLNNQSELTLKLSLNLGTAANATIYIAEVDQNGSVIRNESEFGYNIRVVNSTAAFTKDVREIQAILINSEYGSTSDDDWNHIASDNVPSYGGGSGWTGGNGQTDPNGGYSYYGSGGSGTGSGTGSVQTGDTTPIGLYIALLAAAALLLVLLLFFRMRRKK